MINVLVMKNFWKTIDISDTSQKQRLLKNFPLKLKTVTFILYWTHEQCSFYKNSLALLSFKIGELVTLEIKNSDSLTDFFKKRIWRCKPTISLKDLLTLLPLIRLFTNTLLFLIVNVLFCSIHCKFLDFCSIVFNWL